MKIPYNTEAIHFISEDNIISIDKGVYYFPGCEGIISADIFIDSESIQFRIDGGNPTSRHCMYNLEYCTIGYQGDSITLENYAEIVGFKAVKATGSNALISIIFYKEQ